MEVFNQVPMSEDKANQIYTVLTNFAGARDTERDDFVYHFSKAKEMPNEWRFRGNLGFGGKYWPKRNQVSYYSEDSTEKFQELKTTIDKELKKVEDGQ